MSKGVNKVTLVGHVGREPEMCGDGEKKIANLALATSEQWKDKNTGEKQEKTEWHRVVFFGRLADIVSEYVKKGALLYVEGKIRTRTWEQDGEKKYATEIYANEMQMLNGAEAASGSGGDTSRPRPSPNDAGGRRAATPPSSAQRAARGDRNPDQFDDEIPF